MDGSFATRSIATQLGPIAIRRHGSGPPALLWHSLFVDSTTFDPLARVLASQRELILVDGPGHGLSPGVRRLYTLEDCAAAALEILDSLGISGPVDWLGNAWGGHVGVVFAERYPQRCRSLITVGSPMYPFTPRDRRVNSLLVFLYRLLGPGPFAAPIVKALAGPETRASEPQVAEAVERAFRRGDRGGKYWTMRSVMLHRPDLRPRLPGISTPTLMALAAADPYNDEEEARRAAGSMPHGACAIVPGSGHVGPVVKASPELRELIGSWWARTPETAA